MAKSKCSQVTNQTRKGSNAVNSPVREYDGLNLIESIIKTNGEGNHIKGYSLDLLANFLRQNHDFSKFVIHKNEVEKDNVNLLFERFADSLDFNVYLQRKVATCVKGRFTSEQLACIFQAFNGIWIKYDNSLESNVKEELYDFIDNEGKTKYDIGDVGVFKATIELINPIEFEIFINLIQEVWGIDNDMIFRMHDFLLSDG